MSENPYQAPGVTAARPVKWRRLCLVELMVAVASLAALLALTYLRPFGLLGDGPQSTARRAVAGVMLLLNLVLFGSILTSVIGAVGWAVTAWRQKRAALSAPPKS